MELNVNFLSYNPHAKHHKCSCFEDIYEKCPEEEPCWVIDSCGSFLLMALSASISPRGLERQQLYSQYQKTGLSLALL